MRKKTFATLIAMFASATLLTTQQAQGEVLKIPVGQQSPDLRTVARPTQGMSKNAVRNQFGDPQSAREAVGEPPISSWSYENFNVYFEGNHVIHTVLKNKPKKVIRVPAKDANPQH